MTAILRPYQIDAVAQALLALSEPSARPMLQLPTGAGKTKIAAAIIENYRSKGRRVTFVVPYISIVDQTISAFERDGLTDIGVVQAKHPRRNPDAGVLICSKDTLRSRAACPDVGLVVVDEAHIKDRHLFEWMQARQDIPFLGLSATPWAKGLGRKGRFTSLIKPTSAAALIAARFLVPPRTFVPSKPNLAGVKLSRRTGDYDDRELSSVMRRAAIVGSVVSEWIARAEGRPTFVFAVDKAHALTLQREFIANDVAAGYIDADTSRDERSQIIERLRIGELKVVVNIKTLVAGVDAPFVSCISYARPTLSEMEFVQAVGRGLRPAAGKVDCLILDHADATTTLGLVNTIDRDCLDDTDTDAPRPATTKSQRPNLCPACTAANHVDAVECWHCGHILKTPSVAVHAGELTEFGKAMAPAPVAQLSLFEEYSDADLFGMLRCYGARKGYKRGWAYAKFKSLRGRDPGFVPKTFDAEPDRAVLHWIAQEAAAYARRMREQHTD